MLLLPVAALLLQSYCRKDHDLELLGRLGVTCRLTSQSLKFAPGKGKYLQVLSKSGSLLLICSLFLKPGAELHMFTESQAILAGRYTESSNYLWSVFPNLLAAVATYARHVTKIYMG